MNLKRKTQLEGQSGEVSVRLKTDAGHSLKIPKNFFKLLAKSLHKIGIAGEYEVFILDAVKGRHHTKGLSLALGEEQDENSLVCYFQSGSNDSRRKIRINCTNQTMSAEEIRQCLINYNGSELVEKADGQKSSQQEPALLPDTNTEQKILSDHTSRSAHESISPRQLGQPEEELLSDTKKRATPAHKWLKDPAKIKTFLELMQSLLKDNPDKGISLQDLRLAICQVADIDLASVNPYSLGGQIAQLVRPDGKALLSVSGAGIRKTYRLTDKALKLIEQPSEKLKTELSALPLSTASPKCEDDEELERVGQVSQKVLQLRRLQEELEGLLAEVQARLATAREVLNRILGI